MVLRLESKEINQMICQYLKEKGLDHTAFAFEAETKTKLRSLKPGSLINYLHKALNLEELMSHIDEDVEFN